MNKTDDEPPLDPSQKNHDQEYYVGINVIDFQQLMA